MSQNNLGICYEKGLGTGKDYKKAFEWYFKSANNGSGEGQNNLGECYRYGIGTEINIEGAVTWYKRASCNGIVSANIESKIVSIN